jgi:membrane-bound hydrogenase subunit mbhJ
VYYWHWLRHLLHRPATTGFPTEPDSSVSAMAHADAVRTNGPPPSPALRRSLALRHLDGGSCNGCESELALLAGPDYDFSRYGFSYTPSPRHADVLVVTGVITAAMAPVIRTVYETLPHPKAVVAVGACAVGGGVFAGAPGVLGSLDPILPVTVRIAGCPPTPADILRGLLQAVDGRDPLAVEVPQR